MSLMVLILLASFFVKWPNMPVDPNTIAGAMYYVCNTSVLDRFEGLSLLDKEQRDRTVTDMALLYDFGGLISDPGERRIGLRTLNTNGVKA
ncbi:hypothetical protein F4777DRAFT_553047 [Nemania sp. FL0916]|nr:hypothetical protein F4777DRAFT_553047 [Nemania sp. FL0916]